jgi:BolA protein
MTDQYARSAESHSSLDNAVKAILAVDWPTPHTYARTVRTHDLITEKLTKAFAPAKLDVADDSHLHEGHAGHRPGGESHFSVYIVANAFKGKSRIERHRMINETLMGELKGGVHALAIRALAPGEDGA